MSLDLKYRPNSFDKVIGNDAEIKSFKNALDKENGDHAFIISGPSGTGKTTLARIAAKQIGADDFSISEFNTGTNRGIDTSRAIIEQMKFSMGGVRVFIIDECFSASTSIRTNKGSKPISEIEVSDIVATVAGYSVVEEVFKNKVDLSRVIKLHLSNGNIIYTTKQHKFMTETGWKEAQYLHESDLLFSFTSDIMEDITLQRKVKYENSNMRILQNKVSDKSQWKNYSTFLFQDMWCKSKAKARRAWENFREHLSILWKENSIQRVYEEKILQPDLCGKMEKPTTRISEEAIHQRAWRKGEKFFTKILQFSRIPSSTKKIFRTHVEKQSYERSGNYTEDEGNKKDKWNASYMERYQRRKWTFNRASIIISYCIRLADGICSFFRVKGRELSNKLQNRYSKSGIAIGDRGRWERASIEKEYITRSEKRKKVERVWVENIEVYQQGNNEQSFTGIINNKERDQGFVEFYDLQIEGHPSYFAENIPVHNCHGMTTDAKRALLKPTEEPPSHVYFFFLTTDLAKFFKGDEGKALKTRLFPVKTTKVKPTTIYKHLRKICKKEDLEIDGDTLQFVAKNCDGATRRALKFVDAIRDLEDDEAMMEKLESMTLAEDPEVFEFCRQLFSRKPSWHTLSQFLLSFKEKQDAEGIRRMIMGYAQSVMLKSKSMNDMAAFAANTLECFCDCEYSSGMPGLTLATWQSLEFYNE